MRDMLDRLAAEHPLSETQADEGLADVLVPETFQVVVECDDEAQQREVVRAA